MSFDDDDDNDGCFPNEVNEEDLPWWTEEEKEQAS